MIKKAKYEKPISSLVLFQFYLVIPPQLHVQRPTFSFRNRLPFSLRDWKSPGFCRVQ